MLKVKLKTLNLEQFTIRYQHHRKPLNITEINDKEFHVFNALPILPKQDYWLPVIFRPVY
jgi:hypothetical protein